MTDMTWQPIGTAPLNKRVLIAGGGIVRFGVLDELGNWRATHHGPIKGKPKWWCEIPEPPRDGKSISVPHFAGRSQGE